MRIIGFIEGDSLDEIICPKLKDTSFVQNYLNYLIKFIVEFCLFKYISQQNSDMHKDNIYKLVDNMLLLDFSKLIFKQLIFIAPLRIQ